MHKTYVSRVEEINQMEAELACVERQIDLDCDRIVADERVSVEGFKSLIRKQNKLSREVCRLYKELCM